MLHTSLGVQYLFSQIINPRTNAVFIIWPLGDKLRFTPASPVGSSSCTKRTFKTASSISAAIPLLLV